MNRVYQNTFVNSILKFTQNLFFKAIKDLKSVSQNSFSTIGLPSGLIMRYFWVILLLFSLEQSFSQTVPQLNNNNIPCTGCTTTNSYGFASAALAVANTTATPTNYNLPPNTTFKQCATVKTDINGTVGIFNVLLTNNTSLRIKRLF